jgi:hypothetical protein
MSTAVSLEPRIIDVRVSDETITARLAGGRTIQRPPRLVLGTLRSDA